MSAKNNQQEQQGAEQERERFCLFRLGSFVSHHENLIASFEQSRQALNSGSRLFILLYWLIFWVLSSSLGASAYAGGIALPIIPPNSSFSGFQFSPPYNTGNPFSAAELQTIDAGNVLFMTETFSGNGRTCGTCHIPEKNFNINKFDMQELSPADLQLVLGGTNTDLENPEIVTTLGLFHINQEAGPDTAGNTDTPPGPFRASMPIGGVGFSTLNHFSCSNDATIQSVFFTANPGLTNSNGRSLLCATSGGLPTNSNIVHDGTRDIMLGWAGDGSLIEMFPYEGSPAPGATENCESVITDFAANRDDLEKALGTFALAAVKTHLTKTHNRLPGVDFTCPTPAQLEQMAKFQKWLGRRFELDIRLLEFPREDPDEPDDAEEGRNLFSTRTASCVGCHVNAGASDNQGRVKLIDVPFLTVDGNDDADDNGGNDFPLQIIGANKASRSGISFFEPELDALVTAAISKPGSDLTDFIPFVSFDEGDLVNRSNGEFGFNVQSIIEAVRKSQFFHNAAVCCDIEAAIGHYFTDKFSRSQGGGAVSNAFRGGADGPTALASLASEAGMSQSDVVNKMGFFLRALSSIYSIADCERLADEMKLRIDNDLPLGPPRENCKFAFADVQKVIKGAKVSPNPYLPILADLKAIAKKLNDVQPLVAKGRKTQAKSLLNAIRIDLEGVREDIATTAEL